MRKPIRVLIVDDHAIVREGLTSVLADPDFAVAGEAANGAAAIEQARGCRPDVVLMDLQMPGMSGQEAAAAILEELPGVKILALTTFQDQQTVMECLRAGCHGYVVKDVEKMELKSHIRAVMRGEAVIDPKVAGVLMARVRTGTPAATPKEPVPLTAQQLTIVRLVARGHSNKEIAEQLSLGENTVKGHVAEILQRLEARNRVEAAMIASQRGWL